MPCGYKQRMRAWIGKFVAGVGVVHCFVGLVVFRGIFADVVRDGLVNTVTWQPEGAFALGRADAFWFMAIGLFWVLLGALIDHCERAGQPLPGFLGWALGALALTGGLMMPPSGWWWFLIPALALLRRNRHAEIANH